MKDNLSLIAAATGGFMLSVALAGILKGAPVTGLTKVRVNSYQVADTLTMKARKHDTVSYILEKRA